MKKKNIIKGLHYLIILNFTLEIAYCAYMVFVVLKMDGAAPGPLFDQVKIIDHELFIKRRLYAIEFWIAVGALSIYLALTEFKDFFKK